MAKFLLYPFVFLAFSFGADAKECHLAQNGKGGTMTLNGGSPSSPQIFASVAGDRGGIPKHELSTFNALLDHDLWSYCDAGNDGVGFFVNTNPNSAIVSENGRALFPTNVDGIYYAVKIYSTGGGGGYFPQPNAGNWTLVDSGDRAYWDSKQIKADVTLYQEVSFPGNLNGVSTITPKDSRSLGLIRIGTEDSDDNNPWDIHVTPSSFSVQVMAATCRSASVNNGTNNVDFGDIMFSALKDGRWTETPFILRLNGCNNTVWVRMKLTTPKSELNAAGNWTLMTNTLTGSDAATGIGVELISKFTTADGLNLQPGSEIWSPPTNVGTAQSYDYSFNAYLSRTSGELKPGRFKAIGTFSIDYF